MVKMHLSAAVAVLLAAAACGNEASDAKPAPTVQQPITMGAYRFDVVSRNPVENGERLSAVLGCIGCHTPDLTGEDWSDPDLGVLWTANLTQSAAAFTADELTAMIVEGRRPDRALMDMPSYLFAKLHPDDLAALVAYLRTLPANGARHPDPVIGPKLAEDIASGKFKDSVQRVADLQDEAPPFLGPEHEFARFVLRATCAECHGMNLQGSAEQIPDAPPRPGLQVVGEYSAADFSTLMKTGKATGDRELNLMSAVARRRYSHFTDREIEAIYAYLGELARRGR